MSRSSRQVAAPSIGPVAGVLLSFFVGYLYFRAHRATPLYGDAVGYHEMAKEIWANGLFSKFAGGDYRTWAYPAFLGGVMRLAPVMGVSERAMIFVAQMGLHIAAVFGLRAALRRVTIERWAVDAVFYTMLLHPLVLIYPFYMLTESLSLSLGIGALACSIALVSESRWRLSLGAGAGFLSGLMIAVRPASVFVLPLIGSALVAIWVLERPGPRRMFAIGAAIVFGLVLTLVPQTRNNIVYYHEFSPLVAAPLGNSQTSIGIVLIKYATLIREGTASGVEYVNPFAVDPILADRKPVLWYGRYPGRGALTVALHVFGLLDQDMLFVYNTNLVPAYYPYVAIANFVGIGLGLAGIGVVVAGWRRRAPVERWTAALALVLLVSHLGLHGWFSVESRYGVAALIVLYGFGAICCGWLVRSAGGRQRLLVGVFLVVFCGSATWLSSWVRWQSPKIRAELIQRASSASRR